MNKKEMIKSLEVEFENALKWFEKATNKYDEEYYKEQMKWIEKTIKEIY
jgi:hypothetical protein